MDPIDRPSELGGRTLATKSEGKPVAEKGEEEEE